MRFHKVILVMAALLLCSVPAAAGEAPPVSADPRTAPCKGLKPFNNIDELLYQFYLNLESDCLFVMPVEELEKIWGIKILDRRGKSIEAYLTLRDNEEFKGKPYNSEKDTFFLEVFENSITGNHVFCIGLTAAYEEQHATLFPDGNFPKLFPMPLKKSVYRAKPPVTNFLNDDIIVPHYPKKSGVYSEIDHFDYYWLDSNHTHMISFGGLYGGVHGITVEDHVEQDYLPDNVKIELGEKSCHHN